VGLDEGSDSESESPNNGATKNVYEPLAPFKELFPHSDIVRAL
jgi:hypothetical protein